MLIGKIHPGSGLGDSLFSIIATRVRAADLNVPYGFVGIEHFKGKGWMDIDFGKPVNLKYHIEPGTGKLIIDDPHTLFEINTPYFNPEFNFIQDGTIIDGYGAQDERYWGHRLDKIREWLKIKPRNFGRNECVINFRGGEYKLFDDLYLTKDYWDNAIAKMLEIDKDMFFEIVTDDMEEASKFFQIDGNKFRISHEIGSDWQMIRYAPYLIISNSAFAILPALLNENVKEVIAPFGWNARSASLTKWMGRPQNYYRKFTYI